jgi:hypothetical protein
LTKGSDDYVTEEGRDQAETINVRSQVEMKRAGKPGSSTIRGYRVAGVSFFQPAESMPVQLYQGVCRDRRLNLRWWGCGFLSLANSPDVRFNHEFFIGSGLPSDLPGQFVTFR